MKDKKYLYGLLTGIFGALVVVAIILGILVYKNKSAIDILTNRTETAKSVEDSESIIFGKIKYLLGIIDEKSIYEPNDEDVINGIYKGIFNSLGDDYSHYYTAEEYEKFLEMSKGEYCGIGAYVSTNDKGLCYIVSTMKGEPAEKVGIKAGDIIYKVDGEIVTSKTSDEIVSLLKGKEGTEVDIEIAREGEAEYISFKLKRKKIESHTVDYSVKEDNIGYIRVSSFEDVTTHQFKDALTDLNKKKVKGIVIDLRDNPGGNLNVVVDMLDMFLPKNSLIVYTEDKNGHRSSTYNAKNGVSVNLPVTVLVNENSASASEIFAGVIKDYKLGKVVGNKTFGKGIVQTISRLADGSAIKFTIAKYFTPSGNYIQDKGIKPDVEIKFDVKEYKEKKIDTQLDVAIGQLKKLIKK